MTRRVLSLIVGLVAIAAISPAAEAETRPVQLALWNPVQVFSDDDSISGIRLNLIYGVNQNLKGLDLGLVNHVRGDGLGVQYGLIGYTEGDFTGWQNGFATITKGRFTGFQSSAYNQAGTGELFQWGIVNVGDDVSGLQLGFINVTQNLYGLQVGLINVIQSKDTLPVFPIVNWKF